MAAEEIAGGRTNHLTAPCLYSVVQKSPRLGSPIPELVQPSHFLSFSFPQTGCQFLAARPASIGRCPSVCIGCSREASEWFVLTPVLQATAEKRGPPSRYSSASAILTFSFFPSYLPGYLPVNPIWVLLSLSSVHKPIVAPNCSTVAWHLTCGAFRTQSKSCTPFVVQLFSL